MGDGKEEADTFSAGDKIRKGPRAPASLAAVRRKDSDRADLEGCRRKRARGVGCGR